MSGRPDQLDFLEAQTDRNRLAFLRTELAMGFTLAGMAEVECETGDGEASVQSRKHAEQAYSTLAGFLSRPMHTSRIPHQVYLELTSGLRRLREKLDSLKR